MKYKNNNWVSPEIADLFRAVLKLEDYEEVKDFFRDLMTEKELIEFSQRWKVAQMLNQGIPYTKIEKETGMSSTTIARISKWLTSGMGGYRSMLSKTQNHHHVSSISRLKET